MKIMKYVISAERLKQIEEKIDEQKKIKFKKYIRWLESKRKLTELVYKKGKLELQEKIGRKIPKKEIAIVFIDRGDWDDPYYFADETELSDIHISRDFKRSQKIIYPDPIWDDEETKKEIRKLKKKLNYLIFSKVVE
jgi:hypothetical protein